MGLNLPIRITCYINLHVNELTFTNIFNKSSEKWCWNQGTSLYISRTKNAITFSTGQQWICLMIVPPSTSATPLGSFIAPNFNTYKDHISWFTIYFINWHKIVSSLLRPLWFSLFKSILLVRSSVAFSVNEAPNLLFSSSLDRLSSAFMHHTLFAVASNDSILEFSKGNANSMTCLVKTTFCIILFPVEAKLSLPFPALVGKRSKLPLWAFKVSEFIIGAACTTFSKWCKIPDGSIVILPLDYGIFSIASLSLESDIPKSFFGLGHRAFPWAF